MNKTYERSPEDDAFVKDAVRASQEAYARMENYTPEQQEALSERAQSTRKHGARAAVSRG